MQFGIALEHVLHMREGYREASTEGKYPTGQLLPHDEPSSRNIGDSHSLQTADVLQSAHPDMASSQGSQVRPWVCVPDP